MAKTPKIRTEATSSIPWADIWAAAKVVIDKCIAARQTPVTPEAVLMVVQDPGPIVRRRFEHELERRTGNRYSKAQVKRILAAAYEEGQLAELSDVKALMKVA